VSVRACVCVFASEVCASMCERRVCAGRGKGSR
jgi:hypothetical protein